MDNRHLYRELRCSHCSYQSVCGPGDMVSSLTKIGMLRRTSEPQLELLAELFVSAADKLICPQCDALGLIVTEVTDNTEDDDEDWGMARACEGCRQPIDPERLEIFPDTRLCPTCQAKDEAGELHSDDPEFCPRCGSLMEVRQSRSTGVTRYVTACTGCAYGRR